MERNQFRAALLCAVTAAVFPGMALAQNSAGYKIPQSAIKPGVGYSSSGGYSGGYRSLGQFVLTGPNPNPSVIEYHNTILGHYFMTANPDEAAALDAKANPQTWQRTGKTWDAWKSAASATGLAPVCRFFGTDAYMPDGNRIGPDSHFYTADPAECDFVKTGYQKKANDGKMYPAWTFEENAYYAAPAAGACPSDATPIYRVYNNGQGGQPNHRYYTDPAVGTEMLAKGWVAEPPNGNPVMCAPQ